MDKEIKRGRKNSGGFTIAELLVVVAIVGVLVAISIPIFSKQVEKARDAASVANLRSAYSQAMSYAVHYNGALTSSPMTPPDNPKVRLYGINGNITAVILQGVHLHSNSADAWGGVGDDLPFYNMIATNSEDMVHKNFDLINHGDTGKYNGYYDVEFYLWSRDLRSGMHRSPCHHGGSPSTSPRQIDGRTAPASTWPS